MKVKDSVVLVTGANLWIGKAYVEEFLKAVAKKIYVSARHLKSIENLVKQAPDKLIPLKLDVTSASDIKDAAQKAQDVTILVNNAGVAHMGSLFDLGQFDYARSEMEVNYFGPLHLIRSFAPILKKNGGGTIATVSSIAGHVAFPGFPTYSASKFAAHALIIAARTELSSQGIKVIGVYPGPIDTDMAKDVPMEKFPPSQVAQRTIAAIEKGLEDVFTDKYSEDTYAALRKDPKEVERANRKAFEDMAKAA
ncbi:MAG: SDR family oxidoreductase [Alphaproteobacteria bacterium]|nr:SDR family oxidoreductase [Alphaproteobacteria bacterium]